MMSEVNPSYIELGPGVWLPASVMRFRFSRSSGPGGQNVNKLNTKATLRVDLDELARYMSVGAIGRLVQIGRMYIVGDRLMITSEKSRSQIANRRSCVEKLRRLVVASLKEPRRRRPTRPTLGSVQRRLKSKKRRSDIKTQRRGKSGEGEW